MFQKNLLEGMDYLKNSNLKAKNHFSLYQISQKIIKFLLSVSLFSLLFFSLLFLLRPLNAFLMKIFGNSIFDFYMFFLFHGFLLLMVNCAGPIHFSSSPTTYQTQEIVKNNDGEIGNSESKELEITEPAAGGNVEEIEFPVEEGEESLITVEQKDETLNSEENGEVEGKEIMTSDEESEELEIAEPVAGENGEEIEDLRAEEETEELNRKCEDFIKRMKAGFCSEPRT